MQGEACGLCDLTHYLKAVLSMWDAEKIIFGRILICHGDQTRLITLFLRADAINEKKQLSIRKSNRLTSE
jgi:hypothetical protein